MYCIFDFVYQILSINAADLAFAYCSHVCITRSRLMRSHGLMAYTSLLTNVQTETAFTYVR